MNTRLIATLLALAALIGVVPTTTHASVNWSPVHGHSVNWQAVAPCNTCTNSVNWQTIHTGVTAYGHHNVFLVITATEGTRMQLASTATTPFRALCSGCNGTRWYTWPSTSGGYSSVRGEFGYENDSSWQGASSVYGSWSCVNNYPPGVSGYCDQSNAYSGTWGGHQDVTFYANYLERPSYSSSYQYCYPRFEAHYDNSVVGYWGYNTASFCNGNVA